MGTILLCVCDLIVEKLCGECRCETAFREAATNCHDVCIVFAICVTVVLVALIVKCAIGAWKEAERKATDAERKAKEEKEKEESERKIKSDLLNKYLDCLKEYTKEANKDKSSEGFIQKAKECFTEKCQTIEDNQSSNNQYRQVLEYLIELSQKGQLDKISKETLNSFFNTQNNEEENS